MRSLLLCLVMVPQDLDFTERVQAIETHVTRMLVTRSLSQSEPLKTGMWSHARYGDASVRYWAASALLRYGTTDAVPALGEALKDEDANVSRTARAALQRIGGPRAMEVLERAAESRR